MGYYSDMFSNGNRKGTHAFDADVLALVKTLGATEQKVGDKASEGDQIRLTKGGDESLALVHYNGDTKRDDAKATLVIDIEELAKMPDDIQSAMFEFEQTPGGRREGVVKPPRADAKIEVRR